MILQTENISFIDNADNLSQNTLSLVGYYSLIPDDFYTTEECKITKSISVYVQPCLKNTTIAHNLNWHKKDFISRMKLKRYVRTLPFYNLLIESLNVDNLNVLFKIRANRLSYGQRKIISIIKILISGSKVLIIYDPYEGLDEEYNKMLCKVFENYNVIIK